jgi:putative transposase
MAAYDDYCALIDYLNTGDPEERRRKKHRLPMDCYSQSDCEFFFTICARHQGTPFADPVLAESVVQALLWRKRRHSWTLFCYCLMPDHLHFVMQLPPLEARQSNAGARGQVPEGVLDQVGNFKKYTTTQVWWPRGGSGKLWQRSSYDRIIRYCESLDVAAQYVLNNPVRKGLVSQWEDHPYTAIVDPW